LALALFLLISFNRVVIGCPAAVFGHELLPKLAGPRGNIRLFAAKTQDLSFSQEKRVFQQKFKWVTIPIQVDLVDEAGHIAYIERDFMGDLLSQSDLIMLNTNAFGDRVSMVHGAFPCKAKGFYELKDRTSEKYAYLAQCEELVNTVDYPKVVSFDKSRNLLTSKYYMYEFNPYNYMQFKSIKINGNNNDYIEVARDSKLIITSDVKNFFSLHFDSKQIESNLERTRLGPIANLARLSFFLRILFFKLDMSLSTDVAFFEDAGHIPMMINLPVDSYKYLNPKSGILYTWNIPQGAVDQNFVINMPSIDPAITAQGFKRLGEYGQKYCLEGICSYFFSFLTGGRTLTMKMEITEELVKKGFFPQFVSDVSIYRKAMDWEIELNKGSRNIGMYFEFSGLPKGGHPWSFWLKMTQNGNAEYHCPRKISLKPWG
jgi:hypothetical protein